MRAGLASLAQIDRSMEEASAIMGGGGLATLRRIVLPLVKPAVFAALELPTAGQIRIAGRDVTLLRHATSVWYFSPTRSSRT